MGGRTPSSGVLTTQAITFPRDTADSAQFQAMTTGLGWSAGAANERVRLVDMVEPGTHAGGINPPKGRLRTQTDGLG